MYRLYRQPSEFVKATVFMQEYINFDYIDKNIIILDNFIYKLTWFIELDCYILQSINLLTEKILSSILCTIVLIHG